MRRSAVAFVVAVGMAVISQSSSAAAAYDWSGLFVGANFGYGQANAGWMNQASKPAAAFFDYLPGGSFSHATDGVIGGGQVGYNFQRGPWVYGVETTLDLSAIAANRLSDTTFGAADDLFNARIRALALVSGRLGYAWDNVLAYAKAGIALANIKASVSDVGGITTGTGNDSQWRSGPAFGVGLEYGVTPNLSLGIEYNYIHLDSASYQLGGGAGSYLWEVEISDISLVMVRLNYRFNGQR